jgi:hypothetical protein
VAGNALTYDPSTISVRMLDINMSGEKGVWIDVRAALVPGSPSGERETASGHDNDTCFTSIKSQR